MEGSVVLKYVIQLLLIVGALINISACDVADETSLKIASEKESAEALSIARQNGCLNCHNVTSSIIGPAWVLVSERYKNSPDARAYLIDKVNKGGNGAWNDITGGARMPAHETRVSQTHVEQIVDFIISLKANSESSDNQSNLKE